jgi:hypothetical protein
MRWNVAGGNTGLCGTLSCLIHFYGSYLDENKTKFRISFLVRLGLLIVETRSIQLQKSLKAMTSALLVMQSMPFSHTRQRDFYQLSFIPTPEHNNNALECTDDRQIFNSERGVMVRPFTTNKRTAELRL